MFCFREKSIGLIAKQQKEKSTQIYQGKYGLDALQLLQLWEKSVKRDSNDKNHRRLTLRCIGKGTVLVSVRLRSSCSKISKGAREIIKKAEKQLLQDKVKCINTTIEHNGSNINNNQSRLASMVTNTTDTHQYSKFIDKVREDRFFKIKDGQVNKFNILVRKSNNNRSNQNNLTQARVVGDRNNSNDNHRYKTTITNR